MQFWVVVLLVAGIQTAAPVVTEFRVFDGAAEVTASAVVRVTAAGGRDADPVDAQFPTTPLPPTIYDVEARHVDKAGLVRVKRVERRAIVHYPDEGGRHLEVINLQPGFGALQLRAPRSPLEAYEVALFRAGDRSTPAGTPIAGHDHVLFVVPAGRYDVRVQHAEHGGAPDTHWLLAVDVPADGTRLKLIDSSGR